MWEGQAAASFRELPFPGIPLILNLAAPWRVEDANVDSFLAGLHTGPTAVAGDRGFSCLELRLTPLGTRRLLGRPLHELTNRSVPLEELLPEAETLAQRLRDEHSWEARFDLVERFLSRRLADSIPPPRELEWAWRELIRSGGRVRVRALAVELGWSPRRLIDRFRDHLGLPPKAAARVIRFDRAVIALNAGTPQIAQVPPRAATRTRRISRAMSARSAASPRASSSAAISFKTSPERQPRLALSSTRGAP